MTYFSQQDDREKIAPSFFQVLEKELRENLIHKTIIIMPGYTIVFPHLIFAHM